MKKLVFVMAGIMLFAGNLFAASGDLIVNGNVGVGTTTPTIKLHVVTPALGTSALFTDNTNSALRIVHTSGGVVKLDIDSANTLLISAGGTEKARLSTSGNLGIGLDPGAWKLALNGLGLSFGWFTASDMKYKKNILPVTDPLSKVLSMQGVSYEYATSAFKDKTLPAGRHQGVIAQDIAQVLPEAVTKDADGYMSVNYTEIIPVLIEAIKEQQKQIDLLKTKLAM